MTRNCTTAGIVFSFLLLLGGCQPSSTVRNAAHPSQISYPSFNFEAPNPRDCRDTLLNGIPVYLVEDRRLPVVDVVALVRAGDIHDPDSLAGLGSLTARLMRTGGTKSMTGDQVDERMEFLGANLSSGMSGTAATASLHILKKDLTEGLAVFAEMLQLPRFEPEKLELERKQTLEAISHRWDNPRGVLSVAFPHILYSGFQAGRHATAKSVGAISGSHLLSFHQRFYCPENIILAVSGDFAKSDMLEKLNSLLGNWKPTRREAVPMPEWSQPAATGKVFFVEKEASQSFIRIGQRCLQRPHPDYYALSVLNYVLGGGGFSSRLMERVRSNEGLAYDVRSGVSANYFHPGAFTISLQTKSKSSAYAISLCMEELRKVCAKPVTDEELAKAKQSLIQSFPAMFRSGKDITTNFSWNEFWGRSYDHFDVYRDKIEALTTADLLSAAQKHLRPDSLTIVVVGDLAATRDGDGEHLAKLEDFGEIKVVDIESELE